MKLRDYQQRCIDTIERLIVQGRRRILAVAPTGAGKGTMATAMLELTARAGGSAVFVVHRREILYDIRERLRALGIESGIIMGGAKPDRDLPIQLASVQTLLHERRVLRPDLMIVDEAHHYAADEWKLVVSHVKPHAAVGFTATPQRADGRPLGDMFDYLVDVVSHGELLARGDIVPCKVLRPECPLGFDLADDAAEAYMRYTPGRKAFVFVRSLAHAGETVGNLAKAGVRARVVDTHTPDRERAAIMEAMRSGGVDVVVNFFTMTEGIDIPEVSVIIIARSVGHEGAYMQMVGRALRAHPGKTHATVLDLTGASYVHGLPLENRVYCLKDRGIKRAGDDLREYRAKRHERTPDVLHLELVEATEAQQMRWGRRRVDWAKVGLGEKTDAAIALELGMSVQTVRKIRNEKGIKPAPQASRTGIDWDAVDLAGASDAALAKKLGVHVDTVRENRKKRDIPPCPGRGVKVDVDWDAQPLGKMPDYKLAAQLGVSASTVCVARIKRKIAPFEDQTSGIDWDAQPLGKVADGVLASQLGVTRKSVHRQREARGIPQHWLNRSLKGSHVDWSSVDWSKNNSQIARELQVRVFSVRIARLAARRGKQARPDGPRGSRNVRMSPIQWDKQPLGQVSDRSLAEKLGVSTEAVRSARNYRGIPALTAGTQSEARSG